MHWDPVVAHSAWTVIAFVAFIAIVIWAWGRGRRADFEAAARMALDDEPDERHPERGDEPKD